MSQRAIPRQERAVILRHGVAEVGRSIPRAVDVLGGRGAVTMGGTAAAAVLITAAFAFAAAEEVLWRRYGFRWPATQRCVHGCEELCCSDTELS